VASKQSKAKKQSKAQARQELLRELQKEQKRAERRRNLAIFGVTGIVALAIIGGTAWGIMQKDDGGTDANVNIEGVQKFDITDRSHVQGKVDYPQTPPVGGDHNQYWQNCGFYDEPVQNEHGVHSLEHGAVWITYSPDLPDDEVSQLRDLATQGRYVLISPYDGLPSPIVLSAWDYQLKLDSVDDPRLNEFLDYFVQGPQTLENAPCTGGVGSPEFSG
jgi:hypothetical protein